MNGRQLIQRGWDFVQSSGAASAFKTITFPVAFADATYDMTQAIIGYKDNSDPTSRLDSGLANMWADGQILTSSTAKIGMGFSTAINAVTRGLVSFIAIGNL